MGMIINITAKGDTSRIEQIIRDIVARETGEEPIIHVTSRKPLETSNNK